MPKPTIGRIVHYYYYGHRDGGALQPHGPHAALVTCVHSATCVNLRVFYQDGTDEEVTSVEHEDEAGAFFWAWPPRE